MLKSLIALSATLVLISGCARSDAPGDADRAADVAPAQTTPSTDTPDGSAPVAGPTTEPVSGPTKDEAGNGAAEGDAAPAILATVSFDFGSSHIRKAGRTSLDNLLKTIPAGARLRIAAYTDHVGKREDNEKLAAARASAVRRYLIERSEKLTGTTLKRDAFVLVARGELDPLTQEDCSKAKDELECLARNRRVEVSIDAGRDVSSAQ